MFTYPLLIQLNLINNSVFWVDACLIRNMYPCKDKELEYTLIYLKDSLSNTYSVTDTPEEIVEKIKKAAHEIRGCPNA